MKCYFREIVFLFIQLLVFYVYPIFMFLLEPMGMVLMMLIFTFILSFCLGVVGKHKIKYLYPFVIAILFLPSVFIFYNESALIHSVWYLVISTFGLLMGVIISFIVKKIFNN